MSILAIILVVMSAFMHAGWNLLSKSQHPSSAFFLVASVAGALLLSPVLVLSWDTIAHGISSQVWLLVTLAGFFMALYYIALAGAYRSGDISIAYPIARSAPVIVVTIVTLFLGRGDQVSNLCIAGIMLVVGGCFLIPLRKFNDFRLKNYLDMTCGLALLAAMGTSGYSLLDDEALRILRTTPQIAMGNTGVTLVYAFLESVMASVWLFLYVLASQKGRSEIKNLLLINKTNAVLAGLAIQVTYGIVLISMAFVNNVSYVVGFRQLSIPLGAALGIFVLKEKLYPPKLAGVITMFVGLMLLALG
jgi:drug/metabolite transporter (DMT)-like permease